MKKKVRTVIMSESEEAQVSLWFLKCVLHHWHLAAVQSTENVESAAEPVGEKNPSDWLVSVREERRKKKKGGKAPGARCCIMHDLTLFVRLPLFFASSSSKRIIRHILDWKWCQRNAALS